MTIIELNAASQVVGNAANLVSYVVKKLNEETDITISFDIEK